MSESAIMRPNNSFCFTGLGCGIKLALLPPITIIKYPGATSNLKMSKHSPNRLEKLFAAHAQGLVRFLKRKVNNPEDAEDIAQNAFIRIQRLAEQGELENPKAYLYQTASNLAIDMMRREKLHQNYVRQTISKEQFSDEEFSSITDYCTPERLLSARSELDAIKKAMDDLPIKCRQAFLLHRIKGHSYNDIAKEMGVSVSSVEKYILQALKHSRAVLKELNQEETA